MTALDFKIRDLKYSYALYLTSMEAKVTAGYSVYGNSSSIVYTTITVLMRVIVSMYLPQSVKLSLYKKLIFLLRVNGYAHFELLKCPDPVLLANGVYYGSGIKGLAASAIQDTDGTSFTVFSGDPDATNEILSFKVTSGVYYFAYPAHFPDLVSIKNSSGLDIAEDWKMDIRPFLCLKIISDYKVYEFKNLTTGNGVQFTFNFI